MYADVFEYFYRNLFVDSQEKHRMAANGLFGRPDFKAFLEEYFKVNLENL